MFSRLLFIRAIALVVVSAPIQSLFSEEGASTSHLGQDSSGLQRYATTEGPSLSKKTVSDLETPPLGHLPTLIRKATLSGPIQGKKLTKSDIESESFRLNYQKHMEQLASSVASLTKAYSQTEEDNLRSSYEWLLFREQSPNILAWIRAYFSNPNIYVRVKESLLKKAVAGLEFTEPVDEKTVEGNATVHTTGTGVLRFRPQILPSKPGLNLNLQIDGNVLVNLAAQVGRSQVIQTGNISLRGNVPIHVTETTVTPGEPTVNANAATVTTSVDSDRSILTYDIAKAAVTLGADLQRPDTNQKLARQVENKLTSRIKEELSKILPGPEQLARVLSRNPFNNFSEDHSLMISSTHGELTLQGSYTSDQHLKSPYTPNAPKFNDVDLIASVHQSAFNNNMTMLSGVTITESDYQSEVLDQIDGGNGNQKQPTLITPNSMTFAAENPLQINFHNGKLVFELRSSEFTNKEGTFKSEGAIAKATYHLSATEKGLDLIREGEIQITGNKPNENTAAALKDVARVFFGQSIHFGQLSDGKTGSVIATQATSTNGWLNIGLKYSASANPKAALVLP